MSKEISSYKNYFICTVQRSGKSWLCDLLTRLNHYGAPEEYLNYLLMPEEQCVEGKSMQRLYSEKGFVGVREFVYHVNREKTGCDGPIGLVIEFNQLQFLANQEGQTTAEVFENLYRVFDNPTIFFLRRNDWAAQAVSWYFMAETGMAHYYQSKSESDRTYKGIKYDQRKLVEWYECVRNGYELWDDVLKQNRIVPKEIIYENMKENLYETIASMTRVINGHIKVSCSQIQSASSGGFRKLTFSKKIAYKKKFKKFLLS